MLSISNQSFTRVRGEEMRGSEFELKKTMNTETHVSFFSFAQVPSNRVNSDGRVLSDKSY